MSDQSSAAMIIFEAHVNVITSIIFSGELREASENRNNFRRAFDERRDLVAYAVTRTMPDDPTVNWSEVPWPWSTTSRGIDIGFHDVHLEDGYVAGVFKVKIEALGNVLIDEAFHLRQIVNKSSSIRK